MSQSIDHKGRVERINLERQAYVRSRLSGEFSRIDETFSGSIELTIPVVKGLIGKVKVTRSDHQVE